MITIVPALLPASLGLATPLDFTHAPLPIVSGGARESWGNSP